MTLTEDQVLELIDKLMWKHEKRCLNDPERNFVSGLWQQETYGTIAYEFGYESENHVGTVSRRLFDILSQELKELKESQKLDQVEKVKNNNFCSSIEKIANLYQNFYQSPNIINHTHLNFCSNTPQPPTQDLNKENYAPKIYHDLTQAPKKITKFYNRTSELKILRDLVLNKNIPLISVLGLSGIGKTTLLRQFVELNKEKFEVVIWKNLKLAKSLDTIINDIFSKINTDFILGDDDKLTNFLNLLQQKKCLIIFDNIEELFIRGELAGTYQTKHKEYEKLFSIITNELEHQSSLILISQEQCSEMCYLDAQLELLELEGLYDKEILNNLGLKDQESGLKLIELYEGNFFYLQEVMRFSIKKVFGGKIAVFFKRK
jgi:hypothetical protein